ncbi:2-C-methyl-D-erythritol 2,4-cyclodiphosphate synthase [Marispirochaeta sp.]|uniref:2-C-methyl-D-erythritol 2,4-cyclodiphosphate synthase n=1 Tax=Marispirochaeta sp. TaxID=2038653 RepID=UPI0029C9ACBE|nr:2-C-methyl-D-erythritol 2,4-cyclodiphosphate synthase [Marispirochaeta sp.]
MRIGMGYDLHRLVPGRPLLIGGVIVPAPFGEDGHSDGDVLLHALIDALLGAAALGDIGTHFPPSDPAYKNIDSRKLLATTMEMVRQAGFKLGNIDATVILEKPKLKDYIQTIRTQLAGDLAIDKDMVSIKAKTNESVDAVGESRAVVVHTVVLLFPL